MNLSGIHIPTVVLAIVGAVIVVLILHAMMGHRG